MQMLLSLALLLPLVQAHMTPWTDGMYCLNGTDGTDNQNTNDAVNPLFNLTKSDWWMHHVNKCDEFPPNPGSFLEIPAGGNFTVQIATNRAFTTYSYDGRYVTAWGDGKNHPDDYSITNLAGEPNPGNSSCIPSPNMHTQNETMSAGTVFAISYQSNLADVTPENLVVFTVKKHTPFKMLTTYQVPAALPACPPGGCHCVWGWVPNHCGEPNMYMMPHRCIVTGATSTVPVAPGVPPKWCETDQSQCVQGAKQMIFWNQLDGDNVILEGYQVDGDEKSPGYNYKMGFNDGAQDDIFLPSPPSSPTISSTTPTANTVTTATQSITAVASVISAVSTPSTVPSYNGWTSVGCYVDSVTARTLPVTMSITGPMTVQVCLDACHSRGYQFAGLEYSQECYCGTALPPQVATDGRCDMVCNGNPLQYCGGGNGLNVYQYATNATIAALATATSTAPSVLQTYHGWKSTGCYVDSVSDRKLPIGVNISGGPSAMTVELCLDACHKKGYKYAGLEYSQECWCGTLSPPQAATDGRCDMPCKGNGLNYCGGGNGLNVYHYSVSSNGHKRRSHRSS